MVLNSIKKLCLVAALVLLLTSCGSTDGKATTDERILKIPYPYKSMLAIVSDIDGTTIREFEAYHKFINTKEQTAWGEGLGLDVGDSMWFFAMNDDGEIHDFDGSKNENIMTYFDENCDEKYSKEIKKYFDAGWIDSIHSYGDFSRVDEKSPVYKNEYGELALSSMNEEDIFPTIWINHGNSANVQNIKRPKTKHLSLKYQKGGNPNSEYYHTDKLIEGGVKFYWFSNSFGEFVQETPLYPVKLEDGQNVWGFNRYTGVDRNYRKMSHKYLWSMYDLYEQLSEENLNLLIENGGISLVSQHLGTSYGDYTLTGAAVESLRRLANYEKNNEILVARTSRVLEYCRVRDNLSYKYEKNDDLEIFNITEINDPVLGTEKADENLLYGICFNVDNENNAKILVNNTEVSEDRLIRKDGVIGFKWYEKDVTDYTTIP